MQELIEAIRSAVADGATDDTKRSGAAACRTILAALDANAGEPLTLAPTAPSSPNLGVAIAALRNVPPEQILDLAIERLRAAVATRSVATPSSAPTPTAARSRESFRVQIVPIDPSRLGGGAR